MPVNPVAGVKVTAPVLVSTLKVPSAVVTVVCVHAGALSLAPQSRIELARSG